MQCSAVLELELHVGFTLRELWHLQGLYDSSSGSSPPPSPPPPPPPAGAAALSDVTCANNPSCYYDTDWDKQLQYLFIYHFFGLLWTNQFIVGFG